MIENEENEKQKKWIMKYCTIAYTQLNREVELAFGEMSK